MASSDARHRAENTPQVLAVVVVGASNRLDVAQTIDARAAITVLLAKVDFLLDEIFQQRSVVAACPELAVEWITCRVCKPP